jgi:bidirectional [NiFe] hydrogenase diaphorase subunit
MEPKNQARQNWHDELSSLASKKDNLLEILHVAQRHFGYLAPGVLEEIAQAVSLPPSRVFGVATFYSALSCQPGGRHECLVCMGTACFVAGSEKIVSEVQSSYRIPSGGLCIGGELRLRTAHCLGNCGQAPIVLVDQEAIGHSTPADVLDRLAATINVEGKDGSR